MSASRLHGLRNHPPRSRGRRWRPVLSAAAAAAAAVLFAASAGAWEIGHIGTTWYDPDRNDRAVDLEVYYPALTGGEGVPVGDTGPDRFPVVSFGHGFLMPWSAYTYLWEALVPAGFIVALPRTEGGFLPSHSEFGRDLAFVARRLGALGDDPESPFFGKVAGGAAVAGHSMGGGASVLAAAGNPTIQAVFSLAAAETNPSAIGAAPDVQAAALLFAGSVDCVTPPPQHQVPIYEALGSDCKTLLTLVGGSHCQFAEPNFTCSRGESGCPDPGVSREQQHTLVRDFLLPWLRWALEDDAGGWAEFQNRIAGTGGVESLQQCVPSSLEPAALADGAWAATNPFRERIVFYLPHTSGADLGIYDAAGRRIRTIRDDGSALERPAWHALAWDGRDARGLEAPAGVYWARDSRGTGPALRIVRLAR